MAWMRPAATALLRRSSEAVTPLAMRMAATAAAAADAANGGPLQARRVTAGGRALMWATTGLCMAMFGVAVLAPPDMHHMFHAVWMMDAVGIDDMPRAEPASRRADADAVRTGSTGGGLRRGGTEAPTAYSAVAALQRRNAGDAPPAAL